MKRNICNKNCKNFMLKFGEFLRLNFKSLDNKISWEHNFTKEKYLTEELIEYFLKESKQ